MLLPPQSASPVPIQAQSLGPTIFLPHGREVGDCSCWLRHPSLRKRDFMGLLMHRPKISERAVTATQKVARSMRALCLRCTRSNTTSALKRVLGPCFVSMSIFKPGLLPLLKTDFDQQSDKGKKQVANYLNPPTLQICNLVNKLLYVNKI